MELYQIVIIAAIIVALCIIVAAGYVKAPPDIAYIISGPKKKPKVLIGRAGIKIPFLERKDTLVLKQISIDIKTNGYVPTLDFIGVDIDAVAKVRVKTDEEGIQLAMKNFLNMKEEMIITALTDSLQGNMREIIGTVRLKELNTDRKKFGDEVQEKAQKDMNALGIEIISCNIQRIEDEKGLILALGQDNMSQIQKDASIAKALAERDVAIAEAEAARAANEAKVQSDMQISSRQNELIIRRAELKKESAVKQAEADAAYRIQEQEQQKAVQAATVNAQIIRAEREAELKLKEVEVKQQQLDADIRKVADANKYRAEKDAEAELITRQRTAEAEKYEQEQKAIAQKALADASKYSAEKEAEGIRAKLEAEAAGIAAKGRAEAEAIEAKGRAEAEAMDKKAEAYKKYNNVALAEMYIKILPELVAAAAKPMESIDNINIYSAGNGSDGSPTGSVTAITPAVLKQTFDIIKNVTGVDPSEIMKAETLEAKVTKNVNFTGLDNVTEVHVETSADPAEAAPQDLTE